MSLKSSRNQFTRSHKSLRRARHLYCFFIRKAVEKDKTGKLIRESAVRACEAGIYKGYFNQSGTIANIRDIRWAISRHFWRHHPEFQFFLGWHSYREAYGWGMDGVNDLPRIKVLKKTA